jgi:hypothetical protein
MKAKEIESLKYGEGPGEFWFDGQQVFVLSPSGRRLKNIDRITDGRGGTIYVEKDAFDKNGNLRGGGTWCQTRLEAVNEENLRQFRETVARNNLVYFKWNTIPGWMAIDLIEYMKKDSRVDFKTGKFIPNPEIPE